MQESLNPRQQHILEQLSGSGEVKVAELKESFSVTEMTIRRDLEKLEQMGFARRTFGGAILPAKDIALNERSGFMIEEKVRIGKKAAEFVNDGDSIFIDGGTTTLQLAKALKPNQNVTAVTNALNIAAELLEKKIPTLVIGGVLIESTSSMVGPIAAETLSKMAFDRIFLGATGLSANHGFSNSNVYEAEIKRLAVQQTSEVNLLIDHSKFGANVLVSFANLAQVNRIVTDLLPEQELLSACESAGIEIVLGMKDVRNEEGQHVT